MESRLDRLNDALVHQLKRRRDDSGADDVADRLRGVVNRIEDTQHCTVRGWVAGQTHNDFRTHAERPFAADEQPRQVEAGNVFDRPAELHDRSVGHHHLDPQHVVDGDAVFERVRPPRIGGEIAPNGAGPLTAGVGSVMIPRPLEVLREMHVDQPGFDHGEAVAHVHFENSPHAGQGDHHSTTHWQATASQAGARPARHEGNGVLVAELDDRHDLLGRRGKDDDIGDILRDRETVAFVDQQFVPIRQ